ASHTGVILVGDLDPWTFQATTNDRIVVSIGQVVGSGPDPRFSPWIRLLAPDGASLGNTYSLGGSYGLSAAQIDVRAPQTGTYTVVVTSANPDSQTGPGSYVLTLVGATQQGAVPGAPTMTGSVNGNTVSVSWTPSASG